MLEIDDDLDIQDEIDELLEEIDTEYEEILDEFKDEINDIDCESVFPTYNYINVLFRIYNPENKKIKPILEKAKMIAKRTR